MEFSSIIGWIFVLLWLVAILAGTVAARPWFKGRAGEARVREAARTGLPAPTYFPIHNVTLPTTGGTTQVDHIFVSRFGVFVVETKNMSGWIFGGASQKQWTQVIFRTSFKFQNPLHQNFKHVKALEAALDVPPEAIRSVIVFTGDCEFKSPMPANVLRDREYVG